MGKKRYLLGIAAFAGMIVLILDGKTATAGAYDGIVICIQTVIPSLFPFFILSNLITATYTGTKMKILHPISKLCRLSDGQESLVIPAFLGGYPVAAQTIAQGWRSGQIEKQEAERLMGFCNNAGPSFLFGMASVMFPQNWMAWALWGIHIVSAIITARFIPGKRSCESKIPLQNVSLPNALRSAVSAMASVCGWVVFFRVMIAFLNRWILWMIPKSWQVLAIGILELSNGCMQLPQISDVGLRFIVCSGMLAFGGLCVMMQVSSAAQGLSLKCFFIGKLIQTAVSIVLSWAFVSGESIIFGFLFLLFPLVFMNYRKNGSIPGQAGV